METYIIGEEVLYEMSSYRTYEEWKLIKPITSPDILIRSYRTYEEWKRQGTREGNELQRVLTVPMRNGNHDSQALKHSR